MKVKRATIALGACLWLAANTLGVAAVCNCGCKEVEDFGYHLGTWDEDDERYEDENGDPVTDTKCWRYETASGYFGGDGIWVQGGLVTQWGEKTGFLVEMATYIRLRTGVRRQPDGRRPASWILSGGDQYNSGRPTHL